MKQSCFIKILLSLMFVYIIAPINYISLAAALGVTALCVDIICVWLFTSNYIDYRQFVKQKRVWTAHKKVLFQQLYGTSAESEISQWNENNQYLNDEELDEKASNVNMMIGALIVCIVSSIGLFYLISFETMCFELFIWWSNFV